MKTNASTQVRPASENKVGANQSTDSARISHTAKGEIVLEPDYSSMKAAIEKVKDPVPFEDVKQFYGIEKNG